MYKRKTVSVILVSALAMALCLFAAVITAQKGTAVPMGGIDVKLSRGGFAVDSNFETSRDAAALNLTTDNHGRLSFGVLSKGQYDLKVQLSAQQRKDLEDLVSQTGANQTKDAPGVLVTITGAVDGPITMFWDLKKQKAWLPANFRSKAATTPAYNDRISFETDGVKSVKAEFKAARASGTVTVQILVDESGRVIKP